MSGALRKTMVYLGLAEDDDRYSAYDEYEDEEFDPISGLDDEEHEEPRRAAVTFSFPFAPGARSSIAGSTFSVNGGPSSTVSGAAVAVIVRWGGHRSAFR